MNILNLELKNYRGFEEISLNFDSQINVIIGNNASGKTALLDAITIAGSSFLRGIGGVQSANIQPDDVRIKSFSNGSIINTELQFPVCISSQGNFNNTYLTWVHALNGVGLKTTIKDAKSIIDMGKEIQDNVRSGAKEITLPILACYGTERFWTMKKEKLDDVVWQPSSRFVGYSGCTDSKFSPKNMLLWLKTMTLLECHERQPIPEFQAVKRAMELAFSESYQYKNGNISYDLKHGELVVTYENSIGRQEKMPFRFLSDGYRNTISMIGDIAYRMATLNPQLLKNVTAETSGIVIIDELDMFLHPQWQTRIVETLINIFPKVQFFVTTHSPNIIQNVHKQNIIILENSCKIDNYNNTYGKDANTILNQIMGVDERPIAVKTAINNIYTLIDKGEISVAKLELEKLIGSLGDDVAIAEIRTAIAFEEFSLED